MKTWITGGYVYRYEKRRLERKISVWKMGGLPESAARLRKLQMESSMMSKAMR